MIARLLAASLACLLSLAPALAGGAKRRVAVFEFRAGAEAVASLAGGIVDVIRAETSLEVVGPDDARRIAGAEIDADVAGCRGEAACVAGIARRLQVDEVLLVGISQFGDLIVALQRVSAQGEVLARLAESLPAGTEPDLATLRGYVHKLLPPEEFRRYGTIRVVTNVAGAAVVVDGRLRGVTPLAPLVLSAPASVEVSGTKRGYQDFQARIDVQPEATVEVRPRLLKRETVTWYKKWWVWAIVGGTAAGVATGSLLLIGNGPPSTVSVGLAPGW